MPKEQPMSEATAFSSLKTAFRFPFQGPGWQNRFIIGAALSFGGIIVPIIPLLFVYGYLVKVMHIAIKGEPLELPEWTDWGRLITDGLRSLVVYFVYTLPGLIVMFIGFGLYMAFSIALPIITVNSRNGSEAGVFGVLFIVVMIIFFLSLFIGYLLLALGFIPLPMALGHFIARDKLSAAFHIREWSSLIRANKLGYLIAWVVMAGLFAILYFCIMMLYFTVVLCFLLPFLLAPLGFYLMLVGAAVFGQTYRDSLETAGDAATPAMPAQTA
jgi:hypothetical protein